MSILALFSLFNRVPKCRSFGRPFGRIFRPQNDRLDDAYGSYYKVARAFIRLISNPEAMKVCVGAGMRSEFVMSQLLRIMANLMRPDTLGPAELAYRAMELVADILPASPIERARAS